MLDSTSCRVHHLLADGIKKGIIDLCCRYIIGIHRPKNPDIARFRGSDGHRAYILDHIKETLENHPPSAEEHPCVPSYLMEEDIEMEEDNEPLSLQPSTSCEAI